MGHQPRILIWNVKDRILIHQYRAHKFGILSVAFSPNSRYLVSVGFQHDGYLYVWNWKKGNKVASNKVTSKVNALSFSKDGSYFVTAGLRHVKYWYFKSLGKHSKKSNLSSRETQVLDGRAGILGTLRDCNFVDVACDKSNLNHVYFITDSGILCVFKEGRGIDKWVNLQVSNAYSIKVSSSYVICTCSQGIVRFFEPITLKYYGMLPKPHPLGMDISAISSPDMLAEYTNKDSCYPDAVALTYDESTSKITTVYSDRSFYIWDIKDMKKIGKYRSFIAHTDCVWGVEPCPSDQQDNIENNESTTSALSILPPNSFATYSADGTVRFWNLDHIQSFNSYSSSPLSLHSPDSSIASLPMSTSSSQSSDINVSSTYSTTLSPYKKNIYSRELIKMIYVDSDAAEFSKYKRDIDISDDQYPDFGIRSLKMDKKGMLLATGDRNGNLRVHDMSTWEQITYQEAHDSEILSIDISNPSNKNQPYLIATASRDRLLHIFDVRKNFQLVQSLDDHSSSITSVRFTKNSEKLISSGADKGLIFRQYANSSDTPSLPALNSSGHVLDNDNNMAYVNYHNHSGRSTIFDMTLDVTNRYVATVTGERRLFIFNVESGKPFRVCKPETAEEISTGASFENSGGSLINIDLDPLSGTFAVTSGSDRCIRLFDLVSGNCVEKVCAHAELITSVKFIRSPKESLRIISTCSDGTIFIWSVGKEIVNKMKSRNVDHETKVKQATLMGQITSAKLMDDEKKSALYNNSKMAPPRLRRVSTASMIRPTPTLSQMIRQGERKTFSTVSPAEQKYDDLYKKAAMNRKQRDASLQNITTAAPTLQSNIPSHNNNNNNNNTSNHYDTIHSSIPSSPINRHNPILERNNNKANGSLGKNKDSPSVTEKKSNENIHGKLDRLYNGIPTTGNRDRVTNVINYRLQQQPLGQRTNPVLRKQLSRDALYKKDNKDGMKHRPKSHEGMRRSSTNSITSENNKSASISNIEKPSSPTKEYHNEKKEINNKINNNNNNNNNNGNDNDNDNDNNNDTDNNNNSNNNNDNINIITDINSQYPNNNNHYTTENSMDDMDEDEDTGEDEEEQIIYILPSQDVDDIGKPIEVLTQETTSASSSSSTKDEAMGGRKTPISDNEVKQSDEDEDEEDQDNEHEDDDDDEEEEGSDDNTDDAIIQAITSREAPRMTTSLSRTVSTTMSTTSTNKNRLSMEFLKLQQQQQNDTQSNNNNYNNNNNNNNIDSIENETISTSILDLIPPLPPSHNNNNNNNTNTANLTIDQINDDHLDTKKRNSLPGFIKDMAALNKLHKKLEKSKKRQSITARFLSSLTDKKGQYRESLDNVLNSFKELGNKPNIDSINNDEYDNEKNDISSSTMDKDSLKTIPDTDKNKKKGVVSSDQTDDLPNNNNISKYISTDDDNKNKEIKHSILIENQQESSSPSPPQQQQIAKEITEISLSSPIELEKNDMQNILNDLDGAKILLESVLDSYLSIVKKVDQQHTPQTTTFLSQVETKLRDLTQQVNNTLGNDDNDKEKKLETKEEQHDPATLAMLDKYSTLLLKMVESKINV
ncbi:unnamed protein product [Cunninghamella echinulata]